MRTHEIVLARIEADLTSGRWGLGERLPAERALAAELGVSRPSVREALRVLEAMGIVRTAVGSGPDAGATVIDRPAAGLGAAVRLHVASGTLVVRDVVETRVLLETWAVGQAAAKASGAGLAGAVALLDAMDDPAIGTARFRELDAAFHVELVRLAGNALVEAVMTGLRGAIESYVEAGMERLEDWPRTAVRLRAEHRAILDAVASGDGAGAVAAVREHIEGFYREAGL
ncbi:FadR family transcriptional regulator [Oerskovia turbata]|uniref:FadR family transcriptional regulator n=1 Tax=Oerskovia turbata TaxID=1713 RepID=A0A4Q1KY11_9CELL|nr:FCD domain-containing protein [Oerskovia turbata]RXR25097.1 FadR family transcriptional regulator [Oerskovia turbata]RXR35243.1 FadR family transcriptional regulator [Oerskovia turbata]TGJ95279.1 FadR family transcriptional regulator [Actinotalea fermentans ATCC 43279 = JCM 9966 = DSM 3133]